MSDSKLLSIGEEISIVLDEIGAFETDVQAKLLLSLAELVDVIKGARFLRTEANALVGTRLEALRNGVEWVHF